MLSQGESLDQAMNQMPQANMLQNPWEDRKALPPASVSSKIAAALACFLSAFAIPLSGDDILSLLFLAIFVAFCVLIARAPAFTSILLLPAAILTVLTSEFWVGSIFLAVTIGTASLAFLLTVMRHSYLALLIPVLSAGVSFAALRDLETALFALLFLPAAVLLAIATRLGKRRVTAICFAIGGGLLSLIVVLGIYLWRECGALDRNTIITFATDFRQQLILELIGARDELLAIAREDGGAQAQKIYTQISESFTDAAITNTVSQIFNLIPAIVAVICSVLAFEAQLLLNLLYRRGGLSCVITREARAFGMSVSSAVLYAVSFLLMIFLPGFSMAGAVVQNLCLMLVPGLCVMGMQQLLTLSSGAGGGKRLFLILTVAGAFICYPGGAFYILAMWGAYTVIAGAVQRKIIQKLVENSGIHMPTDGEQQNSDQQKGYTAQERDPEKHENTEEESSSSRERDGEDDSQSRDD